MNLLEHTISLSSHKTSVAGVVPRCATRKHKVPLKFKVLYNDPGSLHGPPMNLLWAFLFALSSVTNPAGMLSLLHPFQT